MIDTFTAAGQGQVFAFFDSLSPAEQRALLSEAAEVDLSEIERLTKTLIVGKASSGVDLSDLAPAPYEALPERGGNAAAWAKAKVVGEEALRAGRVAAFTVAGGQGTRLGYDGPKGTFPVTPVLKKPLFQVFAEKIQAAGKRYGKDIPWFIMTSHQNHAATEAFFREHRFFGLKEGQVSFFRQGRMPAVDFQGKILLETKGSLAMSPDGHGGSLRALERSGALAAMKERGIDIISYFQVDNPLVRAIDPSFIGWHVSTGSDMSSKMVPKAYAEEKLGHFCTQHGRQVVIEYSDLPMSYQKEIDPKTGALRYLPGSIAIHILKRDFVERMAKGGGALPFHRADKKIATIDALGNPVKPDKPNGVKFELFVFDALPSASNPVIIETKRSDDFSPVKNAEGVDSPKTCRDDQVKLFLHWLARQGVTVPGDPAQISLEVSPLFGYDLDSFSERWSTLSPKPAITDGLVLA